MPAVIGPARMSASSSNRTRTSPDPNKEKQLPPAFLKQAAQNSDNIRRLLQDLKDESDEVRAALAANRCPWAFLLRDQDTSVTKTRVL